MTPVYEYGAIISVCIITSFNNSHGADGYRGAIPWHGLGRPTGTGRCHCIQRQNKRITKCQKKYMWMQSTRRKPG